MDSIETATNKINAILKELEQSTGSVVESISLEHVETTHLHSIYQEFAVTVQIELKRNPGQRWNV